MADLFEIVVIIDTVDDDIQSKGYPKEHALDAADNHGREFSSFLFSNLGNLANVRVFSESRMNVS